MGCVEDDTVQSHAENVSGRSLVRECITRLTREQQETIDVLVAALSVVIDEWDDGQDADAILTRHHDTMRAALALARKGG